MSKLTDVEINRAISICLLFIVAEFFVIFYFIKIGVLQSLRIFPNLQKISRILDGSYLSKFQIEGGFNLSKFFTFMIFLPLLTLENRL